MVAEDPPKNYTGTPNFHLLEAGTVLYRVHSRAFAATAFNDTAIKSPFQGGRFDKADDSENYGYLYAAITPETALAERLLRDVPFGGAEYRFLPRKLVAGRVLSRIETTVDLTLVSLISARDLAAVGQTRWLLQTGEYAGTRHWGHWLRDQARKAAGFIWQSRHDAPQLSLVLFDDRCDAEGALACSPEDPFDIDTSEPEVPFELDTPEGIDEVNELLAPYHAGIEPG